MNQILFEVESFAPRMLGQIYQGSFDLSGQTYTVRNVTFLPMTSDKWERISKYWRSVISDGAAEYWSERSKNFLYIYSKSQQHLLAAGYFHSGYVGRYLDGPSQFMNMQAERPQQARLFDQFQREMGLYIRSWYPLLAGSVDYYDLAKNYAAARLVSSTFESYDRPLRVLEIGAGGCLLPMLLAKRIPISRYEVIDLPLLMPLGVGMLGHHAPEATIALPNETEGNAWLRYQSADYFDLEPNSLDVAINVTSFQEMSNAQVRQYFELVSAALRPNGLFLCINRDQKMTRFLDYPWDMIPGEILVNDEDPSSEFFRDGQIIRRRLIRKS